MRYCSHYRSCIHILGGPTLNTKESARLTVEFEHHKWRGYVYLVLHATQHRSACRFLFLPCLKWRIWEPPIVVGLLCGWEGVEKIRGRGTGILTVDVAGVVSSRQIN